MLASEKMARRAPLVARLTLIDERLVQLVGGPASLRAAEDTRALLAERRECRELMRAVGYQAWPVPIDLKEAEAING